MSPAETDRDFEALLEYLKRTRGFDFTGYKRPSLLRRVRKEMVARKIEAFPDYVDFLEVHPEEFAALFNTILINVTTFFRDPQAWEHLKDDVIPRVVSFKPPGEPIRVWCAGCASGEEAYSAAVVLAEVLGAEGFRQRVKIYATDVDDDALTRARQASYPAKELGAVPPDLLEKYFERVDDRFCFQKDLRRQIIFGRHDLIQDAPISRIDLLVCRNTLMYFNAETQARILDRFHFGLNDSGFLFLGRAETLLTYSDSFHPVDLKRRTFTKVPRSGPHERPLVLTRGGEEALGNLLTQVRVRDAALEAVALALIVVSPVGTLALVNERARQTFGLAPTDVGRPLQDLELSYRPVELRSCIERVRAERLPMTLKDVEWHPPGDGDPTYFEVTIKPLPFGNGADGNLGTSVAFADVTRFKRLQFDLQVTNRQLESAYEQLQSTNEELETTNEELQSTVEELETTNEELQSTNEERETMNEELQSTIEELETMNVELRRRGDELNQANGFLEAIMASLRGGVVVLDRNLQVQVWNHRSEDLWGLRRDEVEGKPFLHLDSGLPVEQLRTCVRSCLSGQSSAQEVTVSATNRRGKAIDCRVTCNALLGPDGQVRGAILVMEETDGGVAGAV